jgi:hypothetical protein
MAHSGVKKYVIPTESDFDRKRFNTLKSLIIANQKALRDSSNLLFSEVAELARDIIVMRKKCAKLNTRYRLSRKLP